MGPASRSMKITTPVGISGLMSVVVKTPVVVVAISNRMVISSIRIIVYNHIVIKWADIINMPRSRDIKSVIGIDIARVVREMTIMVVEDVKTSHTR